jgi:xanthine dehydrogenase accessory factor
MSSPVLQALMAALEVRAAVAFVTVVAASGDAGALLGRHMLVWQGDVRAPLSDFDTDPQLEHRIVDAAESALRVGNHATVAFATDAGALTCFIEVQTPPAHLIICGAGHIAVPLAQIAHLCDFEVSVIDDRAQYASQARFPSADRVIAGDFRTELAALRAGHARFDARTCAVLVTRGHQHDVECLVELLDDPLPYIGMIGSRRRVRAVFDLLQSVHNLPRARFSNIYAPVGLDIGAHTPAEIAVAIMGELINVLRGGPAISLRDNLHRTPKREEPA